MDPLSLAERVAPAAAFAARAVRLYALAAAGAAAVVAIYLFRNGGPDDAAQWLGVLLALALAAAPPVVLLLLAAALKALAELPRRIRELPATAREQASVVGRVVQEARLAGGRRAARLPRLLWRFARLSGETRELLTPYAPALPLVSVPFLLLSAASFAAAALELAVALVLLVVLAAS